MNLASSTITCDWRRPLKPALNKSTVVIRPCSIAAVITKTTPKVAITMNISSAMSQTAFVAAKLKLSLSFLGFDWFFAGILGNIVTTNLNPTIFLFYSPYIAAVVVVAFVVAFLATTVIVPVMYV